MSFMKTMEWACKSKEEKEKIMMQMRIKEALRKHTDFVLSHIDEMAEGNYENFEPEEASKMFMIISTVLMNEGYDAETTTKIMVKGLL